MTYFKTQTSLTHNAIMTMLNAAIKKAEAINVPQCIVIVDASGETLGEIKMDGAKFLSRKSARSKALTAASIRNSSDAIPEAAQPQIALATNGDITWLSGGLPILIDGECIGGIGVGSGTGEQDIEVAKAALKAIGADT